MNARRLNVGVMILTGGLASVLDIPVGHGFAVAMLYSVHVILRETV
jgi:hypothetical protein